MEGHLMMSRKERERLNRAYKQAVLGRYQERYPDFGPTLAARSPA